MATEKHRQKPPARDDRRAGTVGQLNQARQRITRLQLRWMLLHRCLGICLAALAATLSLAVAIGIDAWLRAGSPIRYGLLAGCAACIMAVAVRYVAPHWRRLSRDRAALLLERAYPHLAGRLITALQLSSAAQRRHAGASDGLYQIVEREAENAAGKLELARALPARPLLQRSAFAALIVLLFLVLAATNHTLAGIGLTRILLPGSAVQWPLRTRIENLTPEPGKAFPVVRGGTLRVSGKVAGQLPEMGVLRIRTETGISDRIRFDLNTDGTFVVQYRPVTTHLSIVLEIGDAVSPAIQVQMIPPPAIVAMTAECVFPDYTHFEPQSLPDGNVQAILGTKVRLRVRPNKDIETAQMEWDDGQTQLMSRNEDQEFETRFEVAKSGSYRIHLTDQLGFHNDDPVLYHVEMIDNQYPRLDRVVPATSKRVTPTAILPIGALITDDFGVTSVTLCYRQGEDPVQRIQIPMAGERKQVEMDHAWSLRECAFEPNTTLEYWLEAQDTGAHAAEKDWPTSKPRQLRIMEEARLADELAGELKTVLDQLSRMQTRQAEATDGVHQIIRQLETPGEGSSQTTSERTLAEKWRQDRLTRSAGQIGDRLARIAEDFAISEIGRADRRERLRKTAERISQMAATDMPGIVLTLDQALAALQEKSNPTTRPTEGP